VKRITRLGRQLAIDLTRVGDAETGGAAAFGLATSVVSGGLACIAGALVLARLLPEFTHQRAPIPDGSVPAQVPALSTTSAGNP
jgi:hypothetical protein